MTGTYGRGHGGPLRRLTGPTRRRILTAMGNARDGEHIEYMWGSDAPAHNHSYLAPALLGVLGQGEGRRLLDLGCGNGSLTAKYAQAGFNVSGADSSASGIKQAAAANPEIDFRAHDISVPLPQDWTSAFDVIVAAEVIEHLFLPRTLFARAREGLAPGGGLVLSTPFHGYWKNLALAATNQYDAHWGPRMGLRACEVLLRCNADRDGD